MMEFIEDYSKNEFTFFYLYILISFRRKYFYKNYFKENWIYLDFCLIYNIFDIKSNKEVVIFFKSLFLFWALLYF